MNLPWRKRTVETITAPITKIVTNLNAHMAEQDAVAEAEQARARAANDAAVAALAESSKASKRAAAMTAWLG